MWYLNFIKSYQSLNYISKNIGKFLQISSIYSFTQARMLQHYIYLTSLLRENTRDYIYVSPW